MTPAQQKKALAFLKRIVARDDEQNPGPTGYCDEEETTEIRVLLIEAGALPDRRKSKTRKGKP